MWKIVSWSPESCEGTIESEQLGSLSFSAAQTATVDYKVGEIVLVELDQTVNGWSVRRVRPEKAHQPPGTDLDSFAPLNARELWDFAILHHEGDRLIIAGSTDFAYYHNAEVEFADVEYIQCATHFSHAYFRMASANEQSDLRAMIGPWEGRAYCIVSEHGDTDGPRFFIIAGGVQVRMETVFYYRRENLGPGERLAAWVK